MEQVLDVFGIDWKLLLINAANFGVLLAALTYFLYKPMLRMLDARRNKIAEGVRAAEKAEAELKEFEANRGDMLAKAGREADSIVSEARAAGTEKQKEITAQAEGSAARTIAEAEAQAKDLKERAVQESKQEVAKLIVLGMERAFKSK
jgi:F-type H+-transporting ATPase subunit b